LTASFQELSSFSVQLVYLCLAAAAAAVKSWSCYVMICIKWQARLMMQQGVNLPWPLNRCTTYLSHFMIAVSVGYIRIIFLCRWWIFVTT